MVQQQVIALYKEILEQVKQIELSKKNLSSRLLMVKERKSRLVLIYNFLYFERCKHELFKNAAVIALNNRESSVIESLEKLYSYKDGAELIDKIRSEIRLVKQYRSIIKKAIKYPSFQTFVERRATQEIVKYVIEQARSYIIK
ncbi:MAG: hypothetical protein ACOXZ5_00840 [Syntrophomonadaceae bacterium]|jgi:hypothetical protein